MLHELVGRVLVRELSSEPANGHIVETLSPLLIGNGLVQSLRLSHFGGQELVIVLLVHGLLLVLDVTNLSDLTVDVLELLKALLDGLVELHRVLSGVLERLLQVGNLPRKLALGCYNQLELVCDTYTCPEHFSSQPWEGT